LSGVVLLIAARVSNVLKVNKSEVAILIGNTNSNSNNIMWTKTTIIKEYLRTRQKSDHSF